MEKTALPLIATFAMTAKKPVFIPATAYDTGSETASLPHNSAEPDIWATHSKATAVEQDSTCDEASDRLDDNRWFATRSIMTEACGDPTSDESTDR